MSVLSNIRAKQVNPLSWPMLAATAAYGVGFTLFRHTLGVAKSSLFEAMLELGRDLPLIWGLACLVVIALALAYLCVNIYWAGKVSGAVGTILWLFAGICWLVTGGTLLLFAVALPNIWFWAWVYLTRST